MKILIKFFLVTVALFLNSCSLGIMNDNQKNSEFEHLIGKSIEGFDLLVLYSDSSQHCTDVVFPLIITYVETNCSRCVLELKHWADFIKNYSILKKIDFIVIAAGEPNFYFDYNFQKKKYYDFTIYKDREFRFLEKNDLDDLMVVKTIIIDKEGKICFYGSPVLNNELKPVFIQELNELLD